MIIGCGKMYEGPRCVALFHGEESGSESDCTKKRSDAAISV